MFQEYLSGLSRVGFHPVDNAATRRHCGTSYDLDTALGKGNIWFYGIDNLYSIVVSDFGFNCNVPFQFANSPFFSIGLGTYFSQETAAEARGVRPNLFTYAGHDDVFCGEFEKGITVRSVTVSFLPDFHTAFLSKRYPQAFQNRKHVFPETEGSDAFPGATDILHQLGSFRPSGTIARMYYDSKVTELFSMIMQRQINWQSLADKNPIPDCDLAGLRHVMEYLNAHYTEDIYLKTLTRHAGMSQTKLTTLFKQVYGTTISDYIKSLRMTLAREMLADSSQKIETIAGTVGYRFHGSFSTAFKDATGVTPRQYRKSLL